jgi:thiamine kinase-like enzyme
MNELIAGIIVPFIRSLAPPLNSVNSNEIIYNPLVGGSEATLYRFDLNNYSYVIRLFPPHAELQSRMHQIMLAKQAGEMGFGPKIHFVDSQMNGFVMEFIPGRTVEESDFENTFCLAEFAKFLQRLHRSGNSFPLAVSPFKRFRDFYLKMKNTTSICPPRFAEMQALMDELEAIFQILPINRVPSHLDLHPLNIMLWEKRFFLVDWVNGGMSDPFFDLTTFSVFHRLDEAKQLIFLTHYLEREPTHHEWSRFIVTQPIRLLVIAAALFSSDTLSPLSYEDIIRDIALPSLNDFVKRGAILPRSHLGVSMFHEALKLIELDSFRSSLQSLKNCVSL